MRLDYRSTPIGHDNVGRFYCIDLDLPEDDRLVGSLEYGRPGSSRQRQYSLVAGWLKVDEAYRRQGIATELWRRLVEFAAGRSIYAEYTRDGAAFVRSYVARFGDVPGLRGGWKG